jgi:hypothetical protein
MQKMHPNMREFPNRNPRIQYYGGELARSYAPLRRFISNGVRRANAKVIRATQKGAEET